MNDGTSGGAEEKESSAFLKLSDRTGLLMFLIVKEVSLHVEEGFPCAFTLRPEKKKERFFRWN